MPSKVKSLYDKEGTPCKGFNNLVRGWLDGSERIREHATPKAFEPLRKIYESKLDAILKLESDRKKLPHWKAHRLLLSHLTEVMLGLDISQEISDRLTEEQINVRGFRTTLAQGVAKNTGENFTNAIVYALANILSTQDEVLVDKGVAPRLKDELVLQKHVTTPDGKVRTLHIPIEVDFCIFHRTKPEKSILCSAKTRLKEVFHIGTMWKLFFDMLEDPDCQKKWGLSRKSNVLSTKEMIYTFVTADMIPPGGRRSQGPDVERDEPRNLIAVDASFFDYVFVSKSKISHVASSLNLESKKESLFHELGCLIDLTQQVFKDDIDTSKSK